MFRVVPTSELYEKVKNLKASQLKRLYSTGHTTLDEFYKVYLGSCTDITGYPYSGKTLLLREMLISLSKRKGLKHLIYLPDSGASDEVTADLIHSVSGKTLDDRYPNHITPQELRDWMGFIETHFKVVEQLPNTRLTPVDFWNEAAMLDVDTISIDSWNYMANQPGTDYLAQTLSQRNQIAEQSGKHLFTIIHPRNPTASDYEKDTGKLKPPTSQNLMGGSEWNNNGKSIIVCHQETKDSGLYDIYIRKTKPRIVGKYGMVTLQYDWPTQRFYSMHTPNKKTFAFGQEEIINNLEPNINF